MKKLIFFALLFSPTAAYCLPKAELYYSPHCKVCSGLKRSFIPAAKEKYAGKVEWAEINVDSDSAGLASLYALGEKYGKKAAVPAVFAGGKLLVGKAEITAGLDGALGDAAAGLGDGKTAGKDLKAAFGKFSAAAVLGSGLADGINPCAFAVIIFFVSFLAVYGYSRKEIVIIGAAYCLAVFATYLLIGLGIFRFLYAMSGFYFVMKAVYFLVALLCFAFFGLTVYDYLLYKKTGSSEGMTLQLPRFLKSRINAVMGRLRERKGGMRRLFFSSLGIGFLVALIEGVCTGQLYVPTIVFIMKEPGLRGRAFGYLILYNLMFIVPLFGVFALSLCGMGSQKMSDFLKSNLGRIKLLLAAVFLALGIFMLVQ